MRRSVVSLSMSMASSRQQKALACRHYASDVRGIVEEFPTADTFPKEALVLEAVRALTSENANVVDSSAALDSVVQALTLVQSWMHIVRSARTSHAVHIVRRTRGNNGVALMQQRLEFLHGSCPETTPVALFCLARGSLLVVEEDDVTDAETLLSKLRDFASHEDFCCVCNSARDAASTLFACGHVLNYSCAQRLQALGSHGCPVCGDANVVETAMVQSMPEELFEKQVASVTEMIASIAVQSHVEDVTDAVDEDESDEGSFVEVDLDVTPEGGVRLDVEIVR